MACAKIAHFGLFILGHLECDLHQKVTIYTVLCKDCLQ